MPCARSRLRLRRSRRLPITARFYSQAGPRALAVCSWVSPPWRDGASTPNGWRRFCPDAESVAAVVDLSAGLEQEPVALFGFVNEHFQDAGGGHVVMLFA